MAKSSLKFKLLPATEEDCETLGAVELYSFENSIHGSPETNVFNIMFGAPNQASITWRAENFARKLREDSTIRIWKAVIRDPETDTEKIVAVAIWYFHTEAKVIDEWKDVEWPVARNPDFCNVFIGALTNMRRKYMSGTKYGLLSVLGTLAEYRGHGIGAALLEEGLKEGNRLGLTSYYLDSSADGRGIYRKFGFEDLESIKVDLTPYGGVGLSDVLAMRKTITTEDKE